MTKTTATDTSDLTTIGVDIGKDVFHIVSFDSDGRSVLRGKIRRLSLTDVFKNLPRCIVGMEACLSTHFVSRTLRQVESHYRTFRPFVTLFSDLGDEKCQMN